LAGLSGNKFLEKMFQQFLEMKTFHLLHHKIIYLLLNAFNWTKPGRGTTEAAFNHLEYLLWRNEAASSRKLRRNTNNK